ncbi:MAG TPA: NAD(P)-binding protein [Acidimicrobiia bacterium]|nr:NAD(P)-binding protein [Acidimicrobiia bacterium]
MAASERVRVAILGGGVAGLATAFELTSTPELRARHAVTVYQHGWRLGGKCASGRNLAQGSRIEEHGLHMWFGQYENAFALMRACYAELGRPPGARLATVEEAFQPRGEGVLWDDYGGTWVPYRLLFPPNDRVPGDGTPIPDFWEMAMRAVTLGWDQWLERRREAVEERHTALPDWARRVADEVGVAVEHATHAAEEVMLLIARELCRVRIAHPHLPREAAHRHALLLLLDGFRSWVWRHAVAPHLDDDRLRQWFTQLDLATTLMIGIVEDDVHERGFDPLNGIELRAWLRDHGAQEVTLASPFVRACYCGGFAFLDGETATPNLAAGVGALWTVRQLLGYKGALSWRMMAGMGDAVVAPLYEVLRRRGVRFELFHRVTGLSPSANGARIGTVSLVRQARPVGARYDPLVDVDGLPCWPTEPRWDQLEDGAALAAAGVDFETDDGPAPEPRRLEDGVDYDRVVLAISVAALPPLCADLLADTRRPRFAAMVRHAATVMTQSFQVWMRVPLSALGWSLGPYISSTYVEPLDTYCDMSHLLPVEDWPRGAEAASIGYFCGVLADRPGDTPAVTTARARDAAIEFLRDASGVLWPDAHRGSGFDWSLLVAPDGARGEDRFEAQFWRANFAPSERYVLSPAGSLQYRLAPGDSEWENLVFAGDWTHTGLDLGCVEATVMSGMQASRALCGAPATVAGEGHAWLSGERVIAPA